MRREALPKPTPVKPVCQFREAENPGSQQCPNPGGDFPGSPEKAETTATAAARNMEEFCAFLDSQTERVVSEGGDLSDFYNQGWHSLSCHHFSAKSDF